jgi:hypothetical protein
MLVLAMQFSRVDGDAGRLEGHHDRAEAPASWEGREPERRSAPRRCVEHGGATPSKRNSDAGHTGPGGADVGTAQVRADATSGSDRLPDAE